MKKFLPVFLLLGLSLPCGATEPVAVVPLIEEPAGLGLEAKLEVLLELPPSVGRVDRLEVRWSGLKQPGSIHCPEFGSSASFPDLLFFFFSPAQDVYQASIPAGQQGAFDEAAPVNFYDGVPFGHEEDYSFLLQGPVIAQFHVHWWPTPLRSEGVPPCSITDPAIVELEAAELIVWGERVTGVEASTWSRVKGLYQ